MKIFSISLLFTLLFQIANAAEFYLVKIDSFKNGTMRGVGTKIETDGQIAEARQDLGSLYTSKTVSFQPGSALDTVVLNLRIQEHLKDVNFDISRAIEIPKKGESRSMSIRVDNDTYSYNIAVAPVTK